MSVRSYPSRAATALATAGLLSLTALTAGSAAADDVATPAAPGPVTKNLTFTCKFPVVGDRQVKAEVGATFPDSVKVNEPIKVTNFKVGVGIDAATTDALRLVGAASVQGTGTPSVDVNINGMPLGVTLPGLTIPNTKVPGSGAMNLEITGAVPDLTVTKPGKVDFAVGKSFTGTVTPKKADGSDTELGTFDLPCTLDGGQDAALTSVPIQG